MMSDMNINNVLAQMRVMASQAQNKPQVNMDQQVQGAGFSQLLKDSVNAVNDAQKQSGALKKRFEMGDKEVSLVDVSIASEKAKVAFTAMTSVRSKLVKAYQDVMSMSV